MGQLSVYDQVSLCQCPLLTNILQIEKKQIVSVYKVKGFMVNSFSFHFCADETRLLLANNKPKVGVQGFLPSCHVYISFVAFSSVLVATNGRGHNFSMSKLTRTNCYWGSCRFT